MKMVYILSIKNKYPERDAPDRYEDSIWDNKKLLNKAIKGNEDDFIIQKVKLNKRYSI